jgi:hypothetical protein
MGEKDAAAFVFASPHAVRLLRSSTFVEVSGCKGHSSAWTSVVRNAARNSAGRANDWRDFERRKTSAPSSKFAATCDRDAATMLSLMALLRTATRAAEATPVANNPAETVKEALLSFLAAFPRNDWAMFFWLHYLVQQHANIQHRALQCINLNVSMYRSLTAMFRFGRTARSHAIGVRSWENSLYCQLRRRTFAAGCNSRSASRREARSAAIPFPAPPSRPRRRGRDARACGNAGRCTQMSSMATRARNACQVACPSSGKITMRPTNSVMKPIIM